MMIFSDGSSKNNGSSNSTAKSAVWTHLDDSLVKTLPKGSTNQLAELEAIHMACELAMFKYSQEPVTIVTDSQYSINCFTKWCKAWKNNDWKNAKKEAVKHSDLIKETLKLIDQHGRIEFQHQRSHQLSPNAPEDSLQYKKWYGNNMVDKLAAF